MAGSFVGASIELRAMRYIPAPRVAVPCIYARLVTKTFIHQKNWVDRERLVGDLGVQPRDRSLKVAAKCGTKKLRCPGFLSLASLW